MVFPKVLFIMALSFYMYGRTEAQSEEATIPRPSSSIAPTTLQTATISPQGSSADAFFHGIDTTTIPSVGNRELALNRTAKLADDHSAAEQESVRTQDKSPPAEGKFDPARLLQLASKYGIARSAALPAGFTLTPPRPKWTTIKNKTFDHAQPVFFDSLVTSVSTTTTTAAPTSSTTETPTTPTPTTDPTTTEPTETSTVSLTATTPEETTVTSVGTTPSTTTTVTSSSQTTTMLITSTTTTVTPSTQNTTMPTLVTAATTKVTFPTERAFIFSDPDFVFVENVTLFPAPTTIAATATTTVEATTTEVTVTTDVVTDTPATTPLPVTEAALMTDTAVVPVRIVSKAGDELAKVPASESTSESTTPPAETPNTTLAETTTEAPVETTTSTSVTAAVFETTTKLMPDFSKFRPGMDCSESATCDAFIPNSYCKKMDGDFGICACFPSLTPVNTSDLTRPCGERTVCTENPCRGDTDASTCTPFPDRFFPDNFGRYTAQKSFECRCNEGSVGNAHSPVVAGLCCSAGRMMCKDMKNCYGVEDMCDGTPHCQDLTDELFTFCGKRERTLALAHSRTMEDSTDPLFMTSLQSVPHPRAVIQSRADEGLLVGSPFGIPGMIRVPFRSAAWGMTY
ncbi:hypothetical protein RvY_13532 [Ramazzottius varieornatus]|uniref:EB domain-containing protein n=1 Tax=Ramazzottius varieornatus TaxID=947166 RepID=A0A1D1VN74_RAMVA|nr:hypothetical protein RvY_13532 [Ramazzottius varieornatus]